VGPPTQLALFTLGTTEAPTEKEAKAA
jgi:hypothetical protein